MSTRISSLAALALLVLAGCSQAAEAPPDPDSLIECAVGGAGSFARECSVEHVRTDEGAIVTVRHPDGSFRRFVVSEGGGIAVADGAEPATATSRESDIEVAVGWDRYRFPTVPASGE